MVNSSSYDDLSRQHQTQDRNAKAEFKQPYNVLSESKHPSSSCNKSFSETADTDIPTGAFAIEPIPTKTEFNSDMSSENSVNIEENSDLQVSMTSEDLNASICCSVPLDRVQGVLTRFHLPKPDEDTPKAKTTRKLLCLYCDRSFVSANLRQKHVERVHSVKQNRRVSSRRHNQQLTASPCVYCDKLNSTEKTLKDLFHHLINDHSNKYFGCLPCEQRFLSASHLTDHNTLKHELSIPETTANLQSSPATSSKATSKSLPPEDIIDKDEGKTEQIPVKVTRSKTKPKSEEPTVSEIEKVKKLVTKKKSVKLKELMNKKLSVKSSKITLKRRESKRIQAIAKLNETPKRKRSKPSEKKTGTIKPKPEQSDSTNTTEKSSKTVPTCINPYPEFDCFYRVKKITDHSIDNLKISSLTFDDVFDKAFFNRIKCNIEENLLHHIDGKLFKNEESENRISNFEKITNQPQEAQNSSSENYGCEISLNAVTPVASLSLNSQYGEDFESQIEYGSKPSKKKNQTKTDEVFHYKYFTRRKFQASILQHKENRDLSKLDMWTQLIIKKRQQKMLDDQKSAKEIQEYTAGDEYKSRIKREELNRILDRRGPFEDLKEEASKKVALDKLNSDSEDGVSHESFSEVREVLNEILNRVFTEATCLENAVEEVVEKAVNVRIDVREIPSYLNLRQSSSFQNDEIDRSDKITLICSSQETENFELPTNQVRGKNEIIELSGEWARCRMYICAACGAKLPNMKYLMEHKSLYHQNVWVQHYEFVGNQSELYRHLSIPALGKVGAVEERIPCKVWKRSDARTCTKCGKQCNSLGELHRHILECGGDWTWMLARKKCKYRPFGAKSRRKRRGLIHRVHIKRKTEPTEKKKYKKTFDGPRQRPSDADSIQRMLANLPAKRSTRKLISLQDGIYRARKKTQINPPINKKNKVKCGKVIYKSQNIKETTEKTLNTTRVNLTQKNSNSTSRRTLRSLNKVLASRILDSNPKLSVKRKLRVINDKRRTRKCQLIKQDQNEDVFKTENSIESVSSLPKTNNSEKLNKDDESPDKRSSLRSQGKSMKKLSMKQLLTGKINIKSFFPIKKRKNKKNIDLEGESESTTDDTLKNSMRNEPDVPNVDNSNNVFEDIKVDIDVSKEPKKMKKDTFGKLVKSFSMRRKNINKLKQQNDSSKSSEGVVTKENLTCDKAKRTNAKCINENNSNNKRKLKQNFRNVINRVKKLKIDSESPSSSTVIPIETMKIQYENPPKDAFLDKSKLNDKLDPCAPPEKIVIPSMSETRENSADISETAPIVIKFNETEDDPHIPERIFRFESNNEKNLQAKGELNFDTQPVKISTDQNSSVPTPTDSNPSKIIQQGSEMQPISIETSVKPKIVPLVSPNMKGKIRKPTRGLNDCIAMLTSKLQQKTEQTDSNSKSLPKSESCLNLSHSSNIFRPFNEVSVPKLDCILKIPSFKTNYSGAEETALDLSMKSQSNPELNRKPQHENFWQTRKLDFSLPIGYVKPMWTPTTPLPKSNSVDQTIEEVIEGYPKKTEQEATVKPQCQWNSVDNIIQSVIDRYKDTPVVLKDKVPNTKNTIDDIIEFVIASSRVDEGKDMKDPVDHDENLIYDNSHINEGKISNSNLGLPVNEVNNTETVRAGKELLSKLQIEGERPCQNNVKTTKKRIRRKNKQTDDVSSLKIVEKTLLVDAEKSTLLETVAINLEPGSENGNDVTEENTNTLMKCIGDSNVSQALENAEVIQESFSLNTAFVHSSDNKTGNKVNPKRARKLGQVRKNNLKKKGITGQILETNVDNLLNYEEVTKSNVSVINLGMVSTAEVQEPDIKLTTEDEPHLLENKVILVKNKNVIPSDSEDEIPLSILKQTENLVENSDCIEKGEKLSVSEQKVEQAISESNINENIDQSLNIEIEVVKSNKKVVAGKDNTKVERDVIIEKSKQFEKSNQKEDTTSSKFEQTIETVSVIVELENTKVLPECNLIDKSICSTQIISNEKGSNDQEEISKTKSAENEESSKQSLNNVREKCIKEVSSTEEAIDDTSSSENSASLTKQTFSKTSSTVVFKTPKKVRKFSRKPVSKRRSAGRRLKVEEPSKKSLPFDKEVAAENSEADTDDESLLSIKMSLNLKRDIAGSIPKTNTVVQEAEENIIIINNDSSVKNNVINCNENSSITNKTSIKTFPFSKQNKSNDEISSIPPIDGPDINEFSVHVEKHKEDKFFKLTSQNDPSSLIFDKSDINNLFDSGISDESLENLEQQEKLVFLPKKRGKKSKASKTNSKSSIQIFVENEYDHLNKDGSIRQKDNITESQDEFLINKSSRLHQRNSEMELSDGTNSISDISNDKISETQQNHDAESVSPLSPSPSTTVCEKQTRELSIKDQTVTGNLQENNLTKGDTEIGVISDLAVIIDNKKELDYLFSVEPIIPSCAEIQKSSANEIPKTKIKNSKTRFLNKRKSKIKKSHLTKQFKEPAKTNPIEVIPIETETLKNLEQPNPLPIGKRSNDGDNDVGNSSTNLLKATSNRDIDIVESDQNVKQSKSIQNISKPNREVIKRSKSLKSSKTSSNNLSKRSLSLSHTEISQLEMKPEESDKVANETVNIVRKSRATYRRSNKSTSQEDVSPIFDENKFETEEKVGDLPGRRPRSARNKVVSYAETDFNEITDSSTPQEISPENSPGTFSCEEVKNTSNLLKVAERKLSITDKKLPVEENTTLERGANILFTKRKLRKRRTKRKEKFLRKIRINKKLKKPTENKSNEDAVENSIVAQELDQLTKEDISVECSLEAANVNTDDFSNNIVSNGNNSDYVDSLEKYLGNVQKLLPLSKTSVITENLDIREPPIKIIINKQKTRRKSKSFKKNNSKSQNDLFKDFALVIKKPKRLAPIITFTPTDSILKETYPNLVTNLAEPVVGCEESEDKRKIPEENLDESVEEMDMELDEIPINTNIIERNMLPEVNDIKTFVEETIALNNNVKANIKHLKSRKAKKKSARFTKKKSKVPIVTTGSLNLLENVDTLSECPKKTEISLDSLSENNSFGDIIEINISDQISFHTDIEANIKPKSCDDNKPDESLITKLTEDAEELKNDNLGASINEFNGLFTLSNNEMEQEPLLRITKTVTGKKIKKGKAGRKKIIINFKKKDFVENSQECSVLDENESELSHRTSVNNNLLSPEETKITPVVPNEILPNPMDEKECVIKAIVETEKAVSPTQLVKNAIKPERTIRSNVFNENLFESFGNNEVSLDNQETLTEKTHEFEFHMKPTSTPIKTNSFNLVTSKYTEEQDSENIYTFNESDDFEIDKTPELCKRLSRRKVTSLSEPEVLQKNNECDSLKDDDNGRESLFNQRRLSRRKDSTFSETVELLEKNNHNDVSKEFIEYRNTHILDSSNSKKNSSVSKSVEILEVEETNVDICSSEPVENILLDNTGEFEVNNSEKDNTKTSKLNEEEDAKDQKELENEGKQENNVELESTRRKSMRNAKVKALEHIHDEALAELTESQRNRELNRLKVSSQEEEEDVAINGKKNVNRKTKKSQKISKLSQTLDIDNKVLEEDKPPSFADLVADLAGLEELENSIERELSAADDNFVIEKQNDLNITVNLLTEENIGKLNDTSELDNQELRRSRRGSRKIASYNENDLIDPIIDVVDKKKKNRKKDLTDSITQDDVKTKKTKEGVKKLNSDEIFDLLKTSKNEKLLPSDSQNSFAGTLNKYREISLSDKHEDLLPKVSDFTGQVNDATEKINSKDAEKIYEFTESPESSEPIFFPQKGQKRKAEKTLSAENAENSTSSISFQDPSNLENSTEQLTKIGAKDSNYCEICNKSFIRIENLIKHKRTLTHIQKLSELEAKQAEEKSKLDQITSEENSKLNSEESPITFESSLSDINIHNILLKSEKPNKTVLPIVHSSFPNNDSLKLVDIISDVLNKPSLATIRDDDSSFMDSQSQNENQPEFRRYKSLGERKSFDSDNVSNSDHNSLPIGEPYLSKTTILEKQISLLENIIENQTGISYIDDISMSSNNSAIEPSAFSSKQEDSNLPLSKDKNDTLNTMDSSFLKPTQYEEISEDSVNIRNYEDQKLRKTLNRDEELFLECCSLLKSGSEVSSYSNQRSQKVINRLGMRQFDEPESMENKSLVQEPNYNLENDFSDGNSRIPTPLGDSYDDDASDSNTISSNWDINKMEPVFEDNPNITSNLNFQEVLNKAIHQDKVEILSNFRKSSGDEEEVDSVYSNNKKEGTPEASANKKKIITKGARKVFEGLKVSIPTEEINLEEVLNCSPKCKKVELQLLQSTSDDQSISENSSPQKPSRNARKSKPVKKAQVGSNLLFKVKKKKSLLSPGNTTSTNQDKDNIKSIDVYDFEETQDNSDVFPKPDFRAFRCKKSTENLAELESDTESRDDYLEPFIAQPESVTSSLSSSSSIKKSKAHESITKKKCMIMGRIFKNQAKSKIEDIDEEMRDIPIIDNGELVENYVANCKIIKNEMKPKLTETEINQLFDQLLEHNEKDDHSVTVTKPNPKLRPENIKEKEKKVPDNRKKKFKNRKRARTNSESTDDEFNLNKSTKRIYRKNGKAEDNSINLEQELKECIGVASRKSQRKCTSGKQNVLVEYWSSDESQFEALLESQRIDHKSKQQNEVSEPKALKYPESVPPEHVISIVKSNTEFEKVPTILKPPPRPKVKKLQVKRKHTGTKDKTINLNITTNSNKSSDPAGINRRKRAAANPLYHWSSSSEDESQDLIEVKPIREDDEELEDDRPIQHGWIVGESPKKLVTMLAQAKGKKLIDVDCVKEQGKKRTNNSNS